MNYQALFTAFILIGAAVSAGAQATTTPAVDGPHAVGQSDRATGATTTTVRRETPSVSYGQTDRAGLGNDPQTARQIPGVATDPSARQIPGAPANVATGVRDSVTTAQPNLAQRVRRQMMESTTLAPVVSGIRVIESGSALQLIGMVQNQEQMEEAVEVARDNAPENIRIVNGLQIQATVE